MKYLGSKRRVAKHLLPLILEDRKPEPWYSESEQWYVEPFVGGCNMIDKVGGKKIGNDTNHYLIDFFKRIQMGWLPPEHITLEEYKHIRLNKEEDTAMTFWAGIACSYGGKWFGGYVDKYKDSGNGNLRDYQGESFRSIVKQAPLLEGIVFTCSNYWEMEIPDNSIIYCDPPYADTTSYKDKFDSPKFWQWVREMSVSGHSVFVSEYKAPEDFICIKEVVTSTQIANGTNSGNRIKLEKLFILNKE